MQSDREFRKKASKALLCVSEAEKEKGRGGGGEGGFAAFARQGGRARCNAAAAA